MSVVFKSETVSLIDHRDFISKLFAHVEFTSKDGNQETVNLTLDTKIFSIKHDKRKVVRKRNRDCQEGEDALKIKIIFENFLKELPEDVLTKVNKYSVISETEVRGAAKSIIESTSFNHIGLDGGNNSQKPLQCEIGKELFLIPSNSRFYSGCVIEKCKSLVGNKYDIVIADPPWWNKYIRRLKSVNNDLSYKMMYNEDIASIPLKPLLSENCLIAVWCTNAPSNISAVKTIIFPAWGVDYITTWYWMKVSTDLKPLCAFGTGSNKQPFERLILGKVGDVSVPMEQLVVSVPSALHSHKPPLLDLLSPYTNEENPKTLELFARYLLPHTTSVGYEPLKWQHRSLYESVT